ncbi:hypothetical protein V8F06_004850 [Rhypophila decipiens]
MIPFTPRSRSKTGNTMAGSDNGAAMETTKPKPVQFKFVEQYTYSDTSKDGHPTGSSKGPQHDPFIINTPSTTKTDPNVRRFIRSHVMRGKNKKNPDGVKNGAATQSTSVPGPAKQRPGALVPAARAPKTDSLIPRQDSKTKSQGGGTRQVIFSRWMPKPIGSSLSFVQFAEPLPSPKVKMLITAVNYWNKHLYPLSMCVSFDGLDNWIELFARDRAYVNSMLFAAQCISDALDHRAPGRECVVYLGKTLKYLQNNLNDKKTATTDANVAVVLVLILMACGAGDFAVVGHHMGGLKHIMQLRGGVSTLADSPLVQLKACRVDICCALEKGQDPILFSPEEIEAFWDQASLAVELREAKNKCPKVRGVRKKDAEARQWRWSMGPSGDLARGAAIIPALCDALPRGLLPHPNFIGRLTSIFDDLHEFCDACNLSLRTGNRLPFSRFKDVLISTQYRLSRLEAQHAQDVIEGGISESALELDIVRLGTLVFGIVTFLHAEAPSFRYSHVADQVRACLLSLSFSLPDLLRHHAIVTQDPHSAAARASLQKLHLFLWFLFIAHVSAFVNLDNEDLVVGLVSDIFIAIGLKAPHAGALPSFQTTDPIAPYISQSFDMLSVPHGPPYPPTFEASASLAPSTFSATSYSSSTTTDALSFPPEYAHPPSSATSVDDWQPNTPPETPRNQSPSRGVVVTHFEPHYPHLASPDDGNASDTSRSVFDLDHSESRRNLAVERVNVYKSIVAASNLANSQPDQSKDDPPLLYIWDILKDHLWVDWVHRASGKVLAYKAFAVGFGGYPLGRPDQGYPGAF